MQYANNSKSVNFKTRLALDILPTAATDFDFASHIAPFLRNRNFGL
jgi:hypothetical protein